MKNQIRKIDTDEIYIEYFKRNIRRTEIELNLTKCFLKKIEIKLKLKEQKKDLARLEKQILIEKKLSGSSLGF